MEATPTESSYSEIQRAYDFFNKELFSGELPQCLLTFDRIKNSYGYHAGARWENVDGELTDELALNPAYFAKRSIPETLSTLVHEMCHVWQDHFGSPGRGRYHNHEWADKMKSVGLQPFNVKNPNRATGDCVSHKIIEDGLFEQITKQLLEAEFRLSWLDRFGDEVASVVTSGEPEPEKESETSKPKEGPPKSTGGKRTKYTCPNSHYSVWGKADIDPKCGQCDEYMVTE